jgi:uncharacterized protein
MEQLDRAHQTPKNFSLMSARLSGGTESHYQTQLLDGVVTLEHPGVMESSTPDDALHSANTIKQSPHNMTLKLIPYYAWANREPSSTQVWIPYVES